MKQIHSNTVIGEYYLVYIREPERDDNYTQQAWYVRNDGHDDFGGNLYTVYNENKVHQCTVDGSIANEVDDDDILTVYQLNEDEVLTHVVPRAL